MREAIVVIILAVLMHVHAYLSPVSAWKCSSPSKILSATKRLEMNLKQQEKTCKKTLLEFLHFHNPYFANFCKAQLS